MKINEDKIDDATLALLHLVTCERYEDFGARAWKGFDWDTMDRLYKKGLIRDPKGKQKSVVMTEEGCQKSKHLFETLFMNEE